MNWKDRAQTFDQLTWVSDQDYMDKLIQACDLKSNQRVLDIGCGTGKVAGAIAPYVKEVVGVDISPDMIAHANVPSNVRMVVTDARDLGFLETETFDLVVARMVFHHILERLKDAIKECHRVLKAGGRLIVAEGVPPDKSLKSWYAEMMGLKEERLTFMPEDLLKLMRNFRMVTASTFIQPQMSLRNWLEYGGVPEDKKEAIWAMHESLGDSPRGMYRMIETNDDLLMDWTTCLVVATK